MPYGLFVPMPCGAAAGYLDPDQGKIDLPSAYCSCVNPRSGRFSYGQLKAPRAPRRVTRFFYYRSLGPTLVAEFISTGVH
jgi:hypothetical protein